jgi:hypothetical protein
MPVDKGLMSFRNGIGSWRNESLDVDLQYKGSEVSRLLTKSLIMAVGAAVPAKL